MYLLVTLNFLFSHFRFTNFDYFLLDNKRQNTTGSVMLYTLYDMYYVKLIKEFTKVISIVIPNGSLSPQAHLKKL